MTRYRVSLTNTAGAEGIEQMTVAASSEEDAKRIYASLGGSTVEALAAAGLTEWSIEAVA